MAGNTAGAGMEFDGGAGICGDGGGRDAEKSGNCADSAEASCPTGAAGC